MPRSGYTGISYPFRINSRGGVAMSTTDISDPTHIIESIRQIFGTNILERPMEEGFYSTVAPLVFSYNDTPLQNILRLRIVEDLQRLEDRIEVGENDIEFSIEVDEEGIEYLYALITFRVIKYNTYYTAKIKVGDLNNEQTSNR